MIERWMPILGRWHREMRLNYPKFWHLQTVYVAAFAVLASVAVAILAIFIPERPDNITPIEPGFLLVLAACIAVTAMWIRNFLRPLTWKQISNVAVAPGLTLAVVHGAALLIPAFLYGLILESRMANSLHVEDVSTKLLMLGAYQSAAADLNLATLLDIKKPIDKIIWSEIWKSSSNENENPVDKIKEHRTNNLVPFLSGKDPIIYYHYYVAYDRIPKLDSRAKLFIDLKLPDQSDGFTKDKAWECMLWHGLFAAIRQHYAYISNESLRSQEIASLLNGVSTEIAVKKMQLSPDTANDLLVITGNNLITIMGEKDDSLDKLDRSEGSYVVFNDVKPIININGITECNKSIESRPHQITSKEYGNIRLKWEGDIHKNNSVTINNYLQFIKKILIMHGDNRYFLLDLAPLKGWPFAKADIAQMNYDKVIVDKAIINLTNVHYAFYGRKNTYDTFPWFKNWHWFGSKWMPFICLFMLSSLLIACVIAREVEAEEMAVAGMICASIIGLYCALLSAFGNDDLVYLILLCGVVGLLLLMLGGLSVAVYRQRIGVWWRWIIAATGLVLPFTMLSVMAFLTRGCDDFACGSQLDIRRPILVVGCVVLLVVGEAYLFLLGRAVIKPR